MAKQISTTPIADARTLVNSHKQGHETYAIHTWESLVDGFGLVEADLLLQAACLLGNSTTAKELHGEIVNFLHFNAPETFEKS